MTRKRRCLCFSIRWLVLFFIGAAVYYGLEVAFRGHSHWTMAMMGGVLFLIIGNLNERSFRNLPLCPQGLLASLIITAAELIVGSILNLWLGLGVWDYSNMPFNLWGQICLPFSLLWVLVGVLAVILDDVLRARLFGVPMPRYTII